MLRLLANIPVIAACVALFALMVMTFCDVILRSVMNTPIEAATELTRILMAIVVFSVMPTVSAKQEHISVDLMDGWFHMAGLTRWRDGLVSIACGIMLIWPLQRVWILSERLRDYGDVTEYLAISQFYIGWFITASLAVTVAALLLVGLAKLFRPSLLETHL